MTETSHGICVVEIDERDAMGHTRWVKPSEHVRVLAKEVWRLKQLTATEVQPEPAKDPQP